MLAPDLLDRICRRLDDRFGLDALWLFGSESSHQAGPASDVDLAALFRQQPSPLDLLEEREELAALVSRDVDLVDLDRASPILVMQVLRYGRLLVDENPTRRYRLVAAAPARYEDVRIMRREIEHALIDRVRRGRP